MHWRSRSLIAAGALALIAAGAAAAVAEPVCGFSPAGGLAKTAAEGAGTGGGPLGFFTNYGRYMSRTKCIIDETGQPDWPWIITTVALTLAVVAGYLKIARVWLSCYYAEEPRDRNRSLIDLAAIFMLCAICGYVMSVMMFVWPAYRLSVLPLAALNFFTWKFALRPNRFQEAFRAGRVQRELAEELRRHNELLERTINTRTTELTRAKAEADAASAYKSQFIANISHELRTPLTAILGFTHLMQDQVLSDKERADHLASVARNGEHLLAIINDVLDLSKIEAGQMSLERVEFPVSELLQDVLGLLKNKAADKNIGLSLVFTTPVPRHMAGDPTRARQVLINLMGNAVKFTLKGSVRLEASYDEPSRQIVFTVVDSGIGMSSDQIAQLFQRFAQGDATTTRRFGGTGLGLSICKRLCEMMGGTVTVESEEGVGSRFIVRLPVGCEPGEMIKSPVNEAVTRRGPGSAPALGPGRVLLIEDGVDNQRLIGLYLRRAGLTVTIADNGREGFERVRSAAERGEQFDLVLMDMQMPVMNGQEATRAIRLHGYKVPIAALTANSMGGDREAFIAAGCDEYLTKPIDVGGFYATVERMMKTARSRARSA